MSVIRFALIAITVIALAVVLAMVHRGRLTLKYSLLWIALGVVVLICAIFPVIPYACAELLGFDLPSNFIFLVAIFFLLAITLSLSVIVSRQQKRITMLVQELAILENRLGGDVECRGGGCDPQD